MFVWVSAHLPQAQLARVASRLLGLIYAGIARRADQTKEHSVKESERGHLWMCESLHILSSIKFAFCYISIGQRANRPLSYQIETNKLRWFGRLVFSCFCPSTRTGRKEHTKIEITKKIIKLYLGPIKIAEVIISGFLLWCCVCCHCCRCSCYCYSVGCKRNKCDEKLFDSHCEMLSTRILEGLYRCCKY